MQTPNNSSQKKLPKRWNFSVSWLFITSISPSEFNFLCGKTLVAKLAFIITLSIRFDNIKTPFLEKCSYHLLVWTNLYIHTFPDFLRNLSNCNRNFIYWIFGKFRLKIEKRLPIWLNSLFTQTSNFLFFCCFCFNNKI